MLYEGESRGAPTRGTPVLFVVPIKKSGPVVTGPENEKTEREMTPGDGCYSGERCPSASETSQAFFGNFPKYTCLFRALPEIFSISTSHTETRPMPALM